MVNEVVMYQSMFLLGVIMFGFFAVSFGNYSDFAESVTLDNNLQRVLEEISEEIILLLDRASEMRGNSGSITITIPISLDEDYANTPYRIQTDSTGDVIDLVAIADSEEIARISLTYPTSANPDFNLRQISFSGELISSSPNNQITYNYDSSGSPVESIVFT